jgi:hypothetical protein
MRIACPPPGASTTRSLDAELTGREEMAICSGFSRQFAVGPSA